MLLCQVFPSQHFNDVVVFIYLLKVTSYFISGNLKVTCPRKKWLTGPSAKAIRYN